MEGQYVASKEKTTRLLNKQDSDVDISTSIDMEDSVELDMPDSEAASALIDPGAESGTESPLQSPGHVGQTGSRRSGTKKLVAAGLLIGIPLLYLASNLVRKVYPGSDDGQSDDITPAPTDDSFAERPLPHTDAQLAVAVASVATIASLMMPFPWLKRWRKGVDSIARLTAPEHAPVYAQIGTPNQAGSTSSNQTGSASLLLAGSNFSMVSPTTSTGMPTPGMWWWKPLPSVPSSDVFADDHSVEEPVVDRHLMDFISIPDLESDMLAEDISIEQLAADMRLMESIRIPDLKEILGLENIDFEQKPERVHHRIQRRHLENTKDALSPVGLEINSLMKVGMPKHMRQEFSFIHEMINTVVEQQKKQEDEMQMDPDLHLLLVAYSAFNQYLSEIVMKNQTDRGAYYFFNIKMRELINIANIYDINLHESLRARIEAQEIIRSPTDDRALDRDPANLYNAYIKQYFPVLAERQIYGGDKIVYASEQKTFFISIAELLEKKGADLDRPELAFYHFEGCNTGFPDEDLERLLDSAAGVQFSEFKALQLSQQWLEKSLAAMMHTPMGFQRASLLPALFNSTNSGVDIDPSMHSRIESWFEPVQPELKLRDNILLFGAAISLTELIEKNPAFEGMVLDTLLNTDFIYQYKDKSGALHVDTAKLAHILIHKTGHAGKTGLAITSQKSVHVRWPTAFSKYQADILSEEMEKLRKVARKMDKDWPKMDAQANFWLKMPPLAIMLDQIVEEICAMEKVPRLKLEDKISFSYDDKPLIPGSDFNLGVKEPVRVEYTVMEILLGQKRLFERDEGLLSVKNARFPVGFNASQQQLLSLLNTLTSFQTQKRLMQMYGDYSNDREAFKAFSKLRRIVEPSAQRANWAAWEYKGNPNVLLYIHKPKVEKRNILIGGQHVRRKTVLRNADGCKVEILFRLSGNRYRYENMTALAAAANTDAGLRVDLASHLDVEKGLDIGKMELDPVRYEHETDELLFKRIVKWGLVNIDKRVASAAETKMHEILDGFSLVGYVVFIPAMFVSLPVALGLGLLYSVAPKLLQSTIAVREDEVAQLQFDAFKNLLMEAIGGAVGAVVAKGTTKMVNFSVNAYLKIVKGGGAGIKSLGRSKIASQSLKAKKCASMGVTLAICEVIDYDDMFKMIDEEKLLAIAVGNGIQQKTSEAMTKEITRVLDKFISVLLEAAKYPAQDGLNALLPTEEYLTAQGFSSITYRVVGIWPSNIRSPNRIVVFVTFNERRYVIDMEKYFSDPAGIQNNGGLVMGDTEWSQDYASAQSSAIMLYKDFSRKQAAINFFNTLFTSLSE